MVERELATILSPDDYVKLSREFSELGPVIDAIKAYRAMADEIADLEAMIDDPSTDSEMWKMAEAEKPLLEARRDNWRSKSGYRCCRKTRWTIAT